MRFQQRIDQRRQTQQRLPKNFRDKIDQSHVMLLEYTRKRFGLLVNNYGKTRFFSELIFCGLKIEPSIEG
jgi:hypothetical protein